MLAVSTTPACACAGCEVPIAGTEPLVFDPYHRVAYHAACEPPALFADRDRLVAIAKHRIRENRKPGGVEGIGFSELLADLHLPLEEACAVGWKGMQALAKEEGSTLYGGEDLPGEPWDYLLSFLHGTMYMVLRHVDEVTVAEKCNLPLDVAGRAIAEARAKYLLPLDVSLRKFAQARPGAPRIEEEVPGE
jgi:hypothetical protein